MATLEQLTNALRKADAAGDTESARKLAGAIRTMRSAQGPTQEAAQAGQQTYEQAVKDEYNAASLPAQTAQSADDFMRLGLNGASMGFADRAVAGIKSVMGGTYEDNLRAERARTDDARIRSAGPGAAMEIGGAVVPQALLSGGVGAAVPVLGRAGFLASVGREGIAGGVHGALSAAGNGEVDDFGAMAGQGILGTVAGGVGGAVGHGAGRVADVVGRKLGVVPDNSVAPMTTEGLRGAKDVAYDAIKNAGISYHPGSLRRLVGDMKADMVAESFDPGRHANAASVLTRFENGVRPNAKVPAGQDIENIDKMRQIIYRDATGDEANSVMAGIMARRIDDFIANETPRSGAVSPEAASDLVKNAREAHRQYRNARKYDEAIEKGSNAQSNRGDINELRKWLNGNEARFLKPGEKEALKSAVRVGGVENFLDNGVTGAVSNMGGIGGAIALGAMATNPAMALLPLGATATRFLSRNAARGIRKSRVEGLGNVLKGGRAADPVLQGPLSTAVPGAAIGEISGRWHDADRKKRRKSQLSPE